jgi:hypothetical protein
VIQNGGEPTELPLFGSKYIGNKTTFKEAIKNSYIIKC